MSVVIKISVMVIITVTHQIVAIITCTIKPTLTTISITTSIKTTIIRTSTLL